jgi:alkylated DNA repair dioxygenase AlkB
VRNDREPLALPGARLELIAGFLPPARADEVRDLLLAEVAWQQQSIRMFGRWIPEPRLTAWYGDPGATYRYSGRDNVPLPWLPVLAELRDAAEAAAGTGFNSVLVNRYRDGADAMGWHSDDERELGQRPVIASVSLGATRRMQFRPRGGGPTALAVDLPHGSLLVMAGDTQTTYQHRIPRTTAAPGERINLTFRHVRPTSVEP